MGGWRLSGRGPLPSTCPGLRILSCSLAGQLVDSVPVKESQSVSHSSILEANLTIHSVAASVCLPIPPIAFSQNVHLGPRPVF